MKTVPKYCVAVAVKVRALPNAFSTRHCLRVFDGCARSLVPLQRFRESTKAQAGRCRCYVRVPQILMLGLNGAPGRYQ